MSIMDLFRSQPTPPAVTPPTPTSTAASPGTAGNGVTPTPGTPGDPAAGKQQAAPESPLKQFEGLWEPNKDAQGNAIVPTPTPSPVTPLDPTKLQEAVKGLDFTKVVSPDVLAKISAGGQDATAAFTQAMNGVAQAVFSQSALATNKIVESALAKQAEQMLAKMPEMVRQHSVTESLRQENPIFANPAVGPIIEGLKSQLAVKFPNATSAELTAQAKSYLEAVGTSFAPAPKQTENTKSGKKAAEGTDWAAFLEQ